jgi:hypothetical protein
MGLETRHGRSYYYRKERTPDGVRSVYVGGGPYAVLFADSDRLHAREAEAQRRPVRRAVAEGEAISRAWAALYTFARTAVAAHLVVDGYRLHRRQWRRRRYPVPPADPADMAARSKSPAPRVPAGPVTGRLAYDVNHGLRFCVEHGVEPADVETASALMRLCDGQNPDRDAMAALREWIARDGVRMEAERLADGARRCALAGWQNAGAVEMVSAGVRDLRERLGYATAPAVERLLIELVCTGWVVVTAEEARMQNVLTKPGGYTLKEGEALDRRVTRAHARFTRAVETLEKVRALQTLTAVKAGEATPLQRAMARAEIARREREQAAGPPRPALPQHAGDGAAHPAEAADLALTTG